MHIEGHIVDSVVYSFFIEKDVTQEKIVKCMRGQVCDLRVNP